MTGTEEFCGITQSLKRLRSFTFVIVLSLATMYVLTAPAAVVQPASACGECTPSTCCEVLLGRVLSLEFLRIPVHDPVFYLP